MEKSNKSLLWEYFEKLPDGSGRCKTCKKQIACTSGNTTGLGRHLTSFHGNLNKVLKFISYLQNLYFEFLVLLSNLEKIKSLSLSLLESGESFKKFLFLLSNLEKWNPFLFLFSKLENIFSNFSFSSRLDFFASRSSVPWVSQSVNNITSRASCDAKNIFPRIQRRTSQCFACTVNLSIEIDWKPDELDKLNLGGNFW